MHFDEYVHFVVGAKIAGQEIECRCLIIDSIGWDLCNKIFWNWELLLYRIKLPKGWEYVIEDGEIAFREPKEGEWFITAKHYKRLMVTDKTFIEKGFKRPIIKKSLEEQIK